MAGLSARYPPHTREQLLPPPAMMTQPGKSPLLISLFPLNRARIGTVMTRMVWERSKNLLLL